MLFMLEIPDGPGADEIRSEALRKVEKDALDLVVKSSVPVITEQTHGNRFLRDTLLGLRTRFFDEYELLLMRKRIPKQKAVDAMWKRFEKEAFGLLTYPGLDLDNVVDGPLKEGIAGIRAVNIQYTNQ